MLNNYEEHYRSQVGRSEESSDSQEYFDLDETTDYLHITLTSGQDQCSRAAMPDVMGILSRMKEQFKYYKAANISYMSRGNKDLKKEMVDMVMRLQKDSSD